MFTNVYLEYFPLLTQGKSSNIIEIYAQTKARELNGLHFFK